MENNSFLPLISAEMKTEGQTNSTTPPTPPPPPLPTEDQTNNTTPPPPLPTEDQTHNTTPLPPLPTEDQTNNTPLPPPLPLLALPETSATQSQKTPLTKERVKTLLKGATPIPKEHLPPGTDPSSKYFDGTAIHLPTGWLVEQRPRTHENYQGKSDQFFYEPGTGKQFRSLKAVWEHIETRTTPEAGSGGEPLQQQGSTSSTDHDPAGKRKSSDAQGENIYPWEEMKRKIKRKRASQTFDSKNAPESVTWILEDTETDTWLPEVENPEKSRAQWARAFHSMIPIPDPKEVLSTAETANTNKDDEPTNRDNV